VDKLDDLSLINGQQERRLVVLMNILMIRMQEGA